MAEIRLTDEQRQVVLSDNRELLVSAAAGSGKTAVLVERILHLVEHRGYSIDRMLVVTYTRAAAAELRERLEVRFRTKARENPLFARQADLAQSAQISTIHSYCQKVVKEHFRFCEIDPQFVIGDDRTRRTLFHQAMEDTLDVLYPLGKQEPDVAALLKKLPEKELAPLMETLHTFLMSRPDPLGWMRHQADVRWEESTLDDQPVIQAMLGELQLKIEGAMSWWAKADQLKKQPCFPDKYLPMLQSDLVILSDLLDASRQGFLALIDRARQSKFIRMAVFRPETSDEEAVADRFKKIREEYKAIVGEIAKAVPGNLRDALSDMNMMAPALRGLTRAMELLMEHFDMLKQDRGAIDFGDLEHMTLRALHDPEIARAESRRFDAVFVDEYQDVSAIQEEILNLLKRGDDPDQKKQYFFYVGDVKQSIYRFRLAEPRLFLSKLNAFSTEEDAEQRKIVLNKNFRSREAVLDAVNRTFLHVMDSRVTEIDYDRAAMLYPGVPSENDPITELHLLNVSSTRDAARLEAELVARDILAKVGQPMDDTGRLTKFSDMAVLLPVSKGVAQQVEAVLTAHGIPVYSDAGGNALGGEECISAVQHLLLLDNIMNDVALIAELRSPLFEMTEQELAQIRLRKPEREASFYDALTLCAKADDPLGRRCGEVLRTLEEERFLYRAMSPSEYLWDFLMRSGMYAHYGAQPGGKLRQANLRMLCLRAGEYFTQHQEGMSGFLETIQQKLGGDETSPTVVNPWENVVRIMTIHKSKGLEFPTAYVLGMGTGLNRRSAQKELRMHGRLGLGLEYRNEKTRTKRKTLLQTGIELVEKNEERAEKARVLYVALTRPKNRLVMIGSYTGEKNGLESTLENVKQNSLQHNDLTAVADARTYLDWLWQSIRPEDSYVQTEGTEFSTDGMWKTFTNENFQPIPTSFPQKSREWRVFFHSGLDATTVSDTSEVESSVSPVDQLWREAQSAADVPDPLTPVPEYTHLPLKLGVTALVRAVEEESSYRQLSEEDGWESPAEKRTPLITQRPKLMSSLPKQPAFIAPMEESLGALRGTLTHKLLCLLSLDGLRRACMENSLAAYIKEEIRRMTRENVFTEEQSALIDLKKVEQFYLSPMGQRMLASRKVRREWSFNLKIMEPMETIVQGVIDLCFEEDGGWVLVDFKTDRVESTRELWQRYHLQMDIYAKALAASTPLPVKEICLYSLRLGVADSRPQGISPKL